MRRGDTPSRLDCGHDPRVGHGGSHTSQHHVEVPCRASSSPIDCRGRGRELGPEPALDDDDQGDEEPGPVASSTNDATVRDAGEACRVFRSVVSVLLRRWETFLYTLKVGSAGGRRLAPHRTGTCVWIARSESGGNQWPQSRAKTRQPGRCRR